MFGKGIQDWIPCSIHFALKSNCLRVHRIVWLWLKGAWNSFTPFTTCINVFSYCSSLVDLIHLNVTVWVTTGDVPVLIDAAACTSFYSSLSVLPSLDPSSDVSGITVISSSLSLVFKSSAASLHSHYQITKITESTSVNPMTSIDLSNSFICNKWQQHLFDVSMRWTVAQ